MRSSVVPLTVGAFADYHYATTLASEEGLHAWKRLVVVVWPAKGSLVIYRVESCERVVLETPSLPLAIERYNEI